MQSGNIGGKKVKKVYGEIKKSEKVKKEEQGKGKKKRYPSPYTWELIYSSNRKVR